MKEKYAEEISVNAVSALEKLKDGNARFICAERCLGDVSPKARSFASRNGQSPYAVVISCSDSRVISESIFSAGIGDLFVIRAAGNVVDGMTLFFCQDSSAGLSRRRESYNRQIQRQEESAKKEIYAAVATGRRPDTYVPVRFQTLGSSYVQGGRSQDIYF